MRGDSAFGEAGLRIKPSRGGPLSVDIGLEGRAGRRRGLAGILTLRLEF
jgi:hypothetical protein